MFPCYANVFSGETIKIRTYLGTWSTICEAERTEFGSHHTHAQHWASPRDSHQRTPRRHWQVPEKKLHVKQSAWRLLLFLTEEARVPVRRWAPLGVGTPTPGVDSSSEPQTSHPVCSHTGRCGPSNANSLGLKRQLCPNVTLAMIFKSCYVFNTSKSVFMWQRWKTIHLILVVFLLLFYL